MTQNEAFFGDMTSIPTSGGRYTKLEKGVNTIHIIDKPLTGWLCWTEDADGKHPHRALDKSTLPKDCQSPPKFFMAFKVYNYKTKQTEILEITQRTIQEVLFELSKNPKWGDPRYYDISITKSGDGLETKYSIVPEPNSVLTDEEQQAMTDGILNINLNALLTGDDPFETTKDE